MTTRLLLTILYETTTQVTGGAAVLQREWRLGEAWCFYFCPKEKWPETFCAVDGTRGAKLFQGRCQIWRANYCQTAEYKVMDMRQCLDRYPGVLVDFLAARKTLQRFDRSREPPAVGPWRRFFLLWSLLSRLSPRVYTVPLPLLQWLLYPQSTNINPFSYPGSPQVNPFSYAGSPQVNPFSFLGPLSS